MLVTQGKERVWDTTDAIPGAGSTTFGVAMWVHVSLKRTCLPCGPTCFGEGWGGVARVITLATEDLCATRSGICF